MRDEGCNGSEATARTAINEEKTVCSRLTAFSSTALIVRWMGQKDLPETCSRE